MTNDPNPFGPEVLSGFKRLFGEFFGTDHLLREGWLSYQKSMSQSANGDMFIQTSFNCGAIAMFAAMMEMGNADVKAATQMIEEHSPDKLWKGFRNDLAAVDINAAALDRYKKAFYGGCWFINALWFTARGEDPERVVEIMAALDHEFGQIKNQLGSVIGIKPAAATPSSDNFCTHVAAKNPMWRRAARGVSAFVVFFAAYLLAGVLITVLVLQFLRGWFISPPTEGSLFDHALSLFVAVLWGLFGVVLGHAAIHRLFKYVPDRGIALAFILWLVGNYALHFLFFSEQTDWETWQGLVQSAVACVTAWVVFGLPPFSSRSAGSFKPSDKIENRFGSVPGEKMGWFRKKSDKALDPAAAAETINEAFAAHGRGDYSTALRLLRPLAVQGNANAQYNLGNMYMDGQGVPQNDAEAVKWFRRAADQDFVDAQSNLGAMYIDGRGVPQNHAEALRWLRLAAGRGDAEAQSNLGNMYLKADCVQQSFDDAMKWYRRAADQGLAIAQFNLGFGYASGQGVPQNDVMAHMWFNLSAAQGSQDAARNLDTIEQIMTPAQIAEAQKLAREWKPKPER
jgi:hypothetical protein